VKDKTFVTLIHDNEKLISQLLRVRMLQFENRPVTQIKFKSVEWRSS